MDSWIKTFTDGTEEIGDDILISKGKASWSNGRLDEIFSVDISFNSLFAQFINPKSEWHQFDRYLFDGITNKRSLRVVQSRISIRDIGKRIYTSESVYNKLNLFTLRLIDFAPPEYYTILKEDVDKWITLVLGQDFEVFISEKGKYDGKHIIKCS